MSIECGPCSYRTSATGAGAGITVAHDETAGGRAGDGDGLLPPAPNALMKAVLATILARRRANAPLLSGKRVGECLECDGTIEKARGGSVGEFIGEIPVRRKRVMKKDEATRKTAVKLTTQASGPGAMIRILLVDDKEIIREAVKSILKFESDLEVVAEAADGQLAVEMAERYRPDIVLMDLFMPGVDGVETTRKIVTQFPDIKVIGLSLHDEDDKITEMKKAGASAFVSKLDARENLVATIRNCYTNNQIAPNNFGD